MSHLYREDDVRRGIALLDAQGPTNWRRRVNFDRLDMSHKDFCVIAQAYYTDYYTAIRALHGRRYDSDWEAAHGFLPTLFDGPELGRTWKLLIVETATPRTPHRRPWYRRLWPFGR